MRTFEEPSIRTAHRSDSAGCPFVIGPMTRVTKRTFFPAHVGPLTPMQGAWQPRGSRWSSLPSGRTSRTSDEVPLSTS